mmetsp:Transcript_54078/g.96218  ORF Transcript_54078/g.96218 Transcript_54078/m.96218 type:complete len:98 (+) Transcript_54078:72-365(+)
MGCQHIQEMLPTHSQDGHPSTKANTPLIPLGPWGNSMSRVCTEEMYGSVTQVDPGRDPPSLPLRVPPPIQWISGVGVQNKLLGGAIDACLSPPHIRV